jgi:NTP pyrophosphatase (non-canonical NTP hydrolase)
MVRAWQLVNKYGPSNSWTASCGTLAAALGRALKHIEGLCPAAPQSPKGTGVHYSDLVDAVESWASDRKIIQNSTPIVQLMKTVSELGELSDATLKDDKDGIVDGLGDVLVTLIIFARMRGLSLERCLASAYDTIKDRKGYLTPEGVFVKQEAGSEEAQEG